MIIVQNKKTNANIVYERGNAVSKFAAEELQKYVEKITASRLPVYDHPAPGMPSLFIGTVEWCEHTANIDLTEGKSLRFDGYCIKGVQGGLLLTSKAGRGLLFAVYSLLEHIGCRWFFPGAKGEAMPTLEEISLDDDLCLVENPDFEIRNFLDASNKRPIELWGIETIELVDWCCKNKINSVYVHSDPRLDIEGHDRIKSEIKRRDLIYEFGGHGSQFFVDRSLFADKPELFREKDGVRRSDGNFCASSPEAVAMMVEGAERVLEKHREIDILHICFDDVFEGSWCECDSCRSLSVPDQIMTVVNEIDSAIKLRHPAVKVDMILYHDTIDADAITIAPNEGVLGYFAPRERCYAHPIGEPSCELNTRYFQWLQHAVRKFGDQVYVVEYYTDMILFSKMKMYLPQVIVRDLADYKQAGVSKISTLCFLRYSWWAYELNAYVFAKGTWNANYDVNAGLSELCERMYPNSSGMMVAYYRLLEQASAGILTFCGYKDVIYDIRDIPPQSPEFQREHIKRIKESMAMFEACGNLLEIAGKEKELIMDAVQILRITQLEAEAVYNQMLGRYLKFVDKELDEAVFQSYMDNAIEAKKDIRSFIASVSDELKGCCGHDPFVDHLCSDQIDFLEKLKTGSRE